MRIKDVAEGEVFGYRAWARAGAEPSEHLASTPLGAAESAYWAKGPGIKRSAVLVMARTRGGDTWEGEPNEYSVPLRHWAP